MLLTKLVRQALLSLIVKKCTDVHLVAAGAVTLDTLILVWVVQTLDRRMTLGALEAMLAVVPPHAVL